MSEIRFGRVEKWILKQAYLKTVKKELPEGWKNSPCECREAGKVVKASDPSKEIYNWETKRYSKNKMKPCRECLSRDEFLANYFGDTLTESSREMYSKKCRYQIDKKYSSAMVIVARTRNSLIKKGMIRDGWEFWNGFNLTDKGKEKAKELLNEKS